MKGGEKKRRGGREKESISFCHWKRGTLEINKKNYMQTGKPHAG